MFCFFKIKVLLKFDPQLASQIEFVVTEEKKILFNIFSYLI